LKKVTRKEAIVSSAALFGYEQMAGKIFSTNHGRRQKAIDWEISFVVSSHEAVQQDLE